MSRRSYRRRRGSPNYAIIIAFLAAVLVVLSSVAISLHLRDRHPAPTVPSTTEPGTEATSPSTGATAPSTSPTEDTTVPTETEPEPVVKVSSATVTATGDLLMHRPCFNFAYDPDRGTYDFTHYFARLQTYIQAADYAVANLETTLCGLDNGFEYSGYPDFNCPDELVPSLQSVGFDMLLTANNHTYDTISVGFHRTQQVLRDYGIDYTGTIMSTGEKNYLIKELNGIKIGMICYTYETDATDVVALNGAPLPEDIVPLVNTFHEEHPDELNAEMEANIAAMRADGAEAIVLYIHWGYENHTDPSSYQQTIAQNMCDLGVDVIVGGHPHMIQPMELLTSATDGSHTTLCLYSTGNFLSNQRRGEQGIPESGHTEDGILFSFTFAKYSDGTVRVEGADLLPTWSWYHTNSETGRRMYDILPLDDTVTDWQSAYDLPDSAAEKALESYHRTMEIVGEGYAEVLNYLAALPNLETGTETEAQTPSVLNFLQTAIRPVGSTMYVWGGGWNEEDTGAGVEAVTLGVSDRWAEFAAQQDENYNFDTTRYQIHDGLDCSGYVGWAVYNVMETSNGRPGYVGASSKMASDLAARGLGQYIPVEYLTSWQAGDIMSMDGHVWIVVGMCDDGSVLLLHSSPPGVVFSGTSLPDGSDSQAVLLAEQIMSTYFPSWYAKYPDCDCSHTYLTSSSAMRWSRDVLTDEEGLCGMSAEEVIGVLFD